MFPSVKTSVLVFGMVEWKGNPTGEKRERDREIVEITLKGTLKVRRVRLRNHPPTWRSTCPSWQGWCVSVYFLFLFFFFLFFLCRSVSPTVNVLQEVILNSTESLNPVLESIIFFSQGNGVRRKTNIPCLKFTVLHPGVVYGRKVELGSKYHHRKCP